MGNTDESNEDESTGLVKGIVLAILLILGAALSNDARMNTRGDFENRSNPGQRIVIDTGGYFSGKARVSCFRTSTLPCVSESDEIVEYHRNGDIVTFQGSRGIAEFTISNQGLTDADGVVWDRKFR
ncbi:MAG: hypothetical protein U0941_15365 [Planctomycetaceae bacterium]